MSQRSPRLLDKPIIPPRRPENRKQRWGIVAAWLFANLTRVTPIRVGYWLSDRVGDFAYWRTRVYRLGVIDNLRHVYRGQISEMALRRQARRVFRTSARNFWDLGRVPHMAPEEFSRIVRLPENDWSLIESIQAEGKGGIILTGHFGAFDFVIAHGLFSWVPRDVQEALLEVCARRLSPNGIVYLSYNTLPGWSTGVMFREMVLYRVRGIADPAERLREARSFLRYLAGAAQPKETIWAAMLDEHASYFEQGHDWYLLHDDLEAENDPVYFHEMVARAEAHGLQYVTEERSLSSGEVLAPEALEQLDRFAASRIEREQVVDFACNRRFRRSLFCRAGRALPSGPTPGRLAACRFRTCVKPVDTSADPLSPGAERFLGLDGRSLESSDPRLRALLHVLHGVWPGTLDHAAATHVLAEATRRTGGEAPAPELLDRMVYQAVLGQVVSAHLLDPPLATRLPERPFVSPVARYEAAAGGPVTHLLNGSSELEPLDRFVIGLLDGTRTRDDVAAALRETLEAGSLEPTATGGAAGPGEEPMAAEALADLALARLLAGCYILR